MKKFKSKETKEKLLKWINSHPESWGGYEYECFYDFVYTMLKNDEYITKIELAEFIIDNKSWKSQEFIDTFLEDTTDKIIELQRFIEYLKELNKIKIL
jgi:hypothetical protein